MLTLRNGPVLCAGLLITGIAFGQITGTTTPYGTLLQLPPVGLAVSETAQVNVMMPLFTGGAGPYCAGTIAFSSAGAAGTVVGTVSTFGLEPGETFSASLPFTSASSAGARTVIWAAINLSPWKIPTAAGPVFASCSIVSSLETFDSATGVTHAVVTGSAVLSLPAAQTRSASAGLSRPARSTEQPLHVARNRLRASASMALPSNFGFYIRVCQHILRL